MSQLSEEQRKRIEENRIKALKRRAETSNVNKTLSLPVIQPNNNLTHLEHKDASFKAPIVLQTFKQVPSNFTKHNAVQQPDVKHAHVNPAKYDSSLKSSSLSSTSQNGKPDNIFNIKDTVRGTCVLLTRKRFFVDVGYNKEMIDVFKSVPSRLYDIQTKKWNFAIEDHDRLISLLKPLQPNILIAPLPRILTKLFINAPEVRQIKDHDLSVLDPVMLNSLLPFQKDGVRFGIEHGGRVLIADDMGLGKTIQAIAIADYYRKEWPLLVVAPSSVRYSWVESFHTWLPSLASEEITVINSGKDHIPSNKVIIMSYDLLKKLKDALLKRNFRCIIFDESHLLKSPKSARTVAAQAIMKSAKHILMLTGTPALSRPIELYTQISALQPRDFFSSVEYGVRYCNGKKMPWGWDFTGSSNMSELQILLEEILMIRRLKSEVIKQLPSKFRQMVVLDPSLVCTRSKVLKAMSRRMQEVSLKGAERRGVLLEYFHETGEVKLKAVIEYVMDLLEADRKFICFAHHQNVLNGICHAIESKKIDYIRIDGSVNSEQRKKLCDRFQLNDECKVAVLSITAANCGITLTAASLVVFGELFWNPGILTQAEDRAHRIGQEDSVVVQYLVAKGTADDEIWPLVQKKLDILNKAGLSKDNFKSADTVYREDSKQSHLEDFWNELNNSLSTDMFEIDENFDVPEKRAKIDSSDVP